MAEIRRTLSLLPLANMASLGHDRSMTATTKISILLFDGITALDAIGPYEVLRSVPGWEVAFVGKQPGEVRTDVGTLGLIADHGLAEAPAADILLIPGGKGSRALLTDAEVLDWVREVDRDTRWTTSVCTGSLVLGAAGLLSGRRATGHWLYLEPLRDYGAEPVTGRWVEDGKLLTAAGVSAGIDMALHLVGREEGPEVAQAIQLGIEYDPQPPFDAGSPHKAPAAIVEAVRGTERRESVSSRPYAT
jgi:transcriptional regulator GlxA family with amidase domain